MSVGADEVDELERAGFVFRPDSELTQGYFKERPGDLRTHVHVRRAGSFNEQFALPFRDFLRSRPGTAPAAENVHLQQRLIPSQVWVSLGLECR